MFYRSPSLATTAGASRLRAPVRSVPHAIGSGFKAKHFTEDQFEGQMDPLIMVDHFTMTAPTFDPHLHAGISAVTYIFEDSVGNFLNRDTLGCNLALAPGDLYWLTAARGAVHEEKPEQGAQTHALQIFVNLPAQSKTERASSLLVRKGDIPVVIGTDHQVRIVLGRSGAVEGATGTPQEMTLLDGKIAKDGRFTHPLPGGRAAWIYVVSGDLTVGLGSEQTLATEGEAVAVLSAPEQSDVVVTTSSGVQFVLMSSLPLREPFVKHGPLVMSSRQQVEQTLRDHAAGRFGNISP